jgi:Flp pilus assembly protein TadD
MSQERTSIAELRRAVTEMPPSAEAHLRLGTALLKTGALKDAERELRAALALDSKCAGAWVNLGGILAARWEFAASVAANRRAAAAEPTLAIAHYNEAIGHLHLGEAAAAIDCLTKVVELEPKNAAAYYHLGVALQSNGRTAESRLCVAYSIELGYQPSREALQELERLAAGASAEPPDDDDDDSSSQPGCTPSTSSKEKRNGTAEGR